jgi:hypothetical protein
MFVSKGGEDCISVAPQRAPRGYATNLFANIRLDLANKNTLA